MLFADFLQNIIISYSIVGGTYKQIFIKKYIYIFIYTDTGSATHTATPSTPGHPALPIRSHHLMHLHPIWITWCTISAVTILTPIVWSDLNYIHLPDSLPVILTCVRYPIPVFSLQYQSSVFGHTPSARLSPVQPSVNTSRVLLS